MQRAAGRLGIARESATSAQVHVSTWGESLTGCSHAGGDRASGFGMLLQTVLCRSSDGSAGSEYDLERLLQGVDALHQESPAPPLLLPPRQPILAP